MECRVRTPSWEKGECSIPDGYRFDVGRADRAERFFRDELVHTKGRWAGQPFNPEPFQLIDIREIYGRVREDGNRVIRTVYKEVPKKNGKSEEAAGHALKLTFADDEPSAEVYGAASDRDQASIVFNVAASMVRRNSRLSRISKIIDSTKRILLPEWESFYRAISSEVAGKHGYNSHGVIFDEIHAQQDFRLWEVLTFGAGAARTQPLICGITTAGVPGESPVAEMLHEEADQILRGVLPCPLSFYPVIYAAPTEADWNDEEVWRSCNPAIGSFLPIESVREEFERARRRPAEQNSFRRLRLNQWVQQVTRWIDMDLWDVCGAKCSDWNAYSAWVESEIRELRELTWYAGLDLSTKLDVTAFVLVCLDGNGMLHVLPHFWVPGDYATNRPNIEAERYREWTRQGFLNATQGNAVHYEAMREKILELGRELRIQEIVYDPKFAPDFSQRLGPEGDGFTVVEMGQGYSGYTAPCDDLETLLADRRLRHGGHPVLRWMADCVAIQQRGDGAKRPVKPERAKSGKRIDGIVAMLMGISRATVSSVSDIPHILFA